MTDEVRNLLVVGVKTSNDIGSVRSALVAAGVPEPAFEVKVEPPAQPFTDLDQYYRPVVGGLGGYYYASGLYFPCTVGLTSQPSGQSRMFMINSHCSATRFSDATTPTSYFWQSDGGVVAHLLGSKVLDRERFTNAQNAYCPLNEACRWSDAAFLSITGPNTGGETLGRVARTLWPGQWDGSRTLDAASTFFGVTSDNAGAVAVGTLLDKVGRATGWTQGSVSLTCQDMLTTGAYLICQDRVAAGGAPGDSGSPVFEQVSGTAIRFFGILWGGLENSYYNFSALWNIQEDFGTIITH